MTFARDEAPLDNPVYAALTGAHARLAEVRGRARRYPPDVSPFSAVPLRPSHADWQDLTALVGAEGFAVVINDDADGSPDDWRVMRTFELTQMVGATTTGAAGDELLELGAEDVPEMLDLAAQTEPGPFLTRTIELGTYLGIRRGGALVAMAGERFRFDGWTELSAICTLPGHRGQGFAARLIRSLIAGIEARGERPFLHTLSSNTGAIRLYEQLGFVVRQTAQIAVMSPASAT